MVVATKPILSVSYLFENGTETHFAKEPFLKYVDRREPLIKKTVCTSSRHISFTKSRARSSRAYELKIHKIHKSHAYEEESSQSHACEYRIHVYKLRDCKHLKNSTVSDAIIQTVVEDPVHDDRIPVEAGSEPVPVPCEPSESEKMKHEFTHIPFKPWCTSCVKGKAHSEPRKRIERIAEDSERPIVQRDYLVLNDTAAGGLKVQSMYVNSFGYGTSTVVETKGATDTFAVTWKVKS